MDGGDAWDNDPGAGVDLNLYRHKDAYYFLPSEDEWYKSAYHKNDGVTANYWDYAMGSNSVPDGIDFVGDLVFDAVFFDGGNNAQPNGVTSPYGTLGQNGNVWEWGETLFGMSNILFSSRTIRGGPWGTTEVDLRSSDREEINAANSSRNVGFRIASVPEPTASMLMIVSGMMRPIRRRRESAL